MEAKCNIFRNSFSPQCTHEVPTLHVLRAIKNGKWKDIVESVRGCKSKDERNELKKGLPAVTFSGTFNDTRKESNLKEYSSLLVVDIDNIKPHELNRIKSSLMQDPFIISFFESPSRGLKALVEVTSPAEKHKTTAFPFVQEYFKDAHSIVIDRSGKDVSRLCYVSYDPNLYYTSTYDVFDVPEDYETEEERRKRYHFESLRKDGLITESNNVNHVFKTCRQWVSNGSVGGYHKGNRNNFIHALACCLNRAGMSMSIAIHLMATTYQSLELKEIETTVSSAYRHNKHEHGTRPVFVKKKNQQSLI